MLEAKAFSRGASTGIAGGFPNQQNATSEQSTCSDVANYQIYVLDVAHVL